MLEANVFCFAIRHKPLCYDQMFIGSLQLSSTSSTILYVPLYYDQMHANAFHLHNFLMIKSAPLSYASSKRFLQMRVNALCLQKTSFTISYIFLLIINKHALLQNVCDKSLMTIVVSYITTECSSLKCAYRLRLHFIIHCLPLVMVKCVRPHCTCSQRL